MADKEKNKKKLKVRRAKHKNSSIDEWDSYNTKDKKEKRDKRKDRDRKKDKKKEKKHHFNDKKKKEVDEEKDKTEATKQFRRPKSSRSEKDKKIKSKRRDSKLKRVTPKAEDGDGFGSIKNRSKIASKRKDKRDSGFGNLPNLNIQNEKKFEFDDNADIGQSNIHFTAKEHSKKKRKKSSSHSEQAVETKNMKNLEEIEKEKAKMQQERIKKLKEIRAAKSAEKQREADKLKKKTRKRGHSKGHKHDYHKEKTPEKKGVDEKEETGEERKARKQKEKQQRLERLKNLRMQHEDQKKKTQKELQEFIRKRDSKRYTYAYNAYPKDAKKARQLVYKSLRRLKELCPIVSFEYDPNNKNVEPILNPYGLSVTHMDCLVAYYMVDIEWNGVITKLEYINCIKKLLKIKEWNDEKIDIVWNNLLVSKSITKQIYDEYVSDMKHSEEKKVDLDNDPVYNYKGCSQTNGLTIIDFINGFHLCRSKDIEKRNSALYDFYYLLLGGHFYDDSLAEEDDWHGDFTQRVLWLKQFGEKVEVLYSIDQGNSFIGACHGVQEYRAIICSLLNVDFIPPSDKHSGEIISKFKDLISDTVGKIKLFQYEWFQGEVLIGAAKICILRSDIMYSSMKPINIILKECDRLLTMLESKVLVQSAMHLMKVVVIHCPTKQQDLLLKELSGLISGANYRHRSFVPLQQLLLLLLVAIDRYNIQNSKTWQRIAGVPIFACSHEKQEISDLGEEVLWRIYTFSPSVGEDILSNKMEKKKAKHVRKALGIEKYWEQQQLQKAGMKTIKIYQDTDPIPNNWKKLTYNPALNEMSPARVWTMMQKVVYGDIDLLDEHPSMNYDDFVKGLSECQSYLRASSVRALFQCLPRKHRPFVTKQEFIDFICMSHVAPNRRHYSLRIKELLTIEEDKWKTDELEKKRIAQQKAIEREQQRLKRKQERADKKRLNEEKRRKKESARKEREQLRKEQALAKQEEERQIKFEKEQEEKRKLEEEEKKKLEAEIAEKKRLKKLEKEQRKKERKEERRKRREAKKKKKANAPKLDTSMDALQENEEQEVVRQQTPQNSSRKTEHSKTKTREEEVWQDMVALLDFGDDDDDDAAGYDFKIDKSHGSDEDSEPSLSYAGQPKTPYYGKRSSITSVNSALNTPTFADFGNKSITGFSPNRHGHGYKTSWGVDADLDSIIGDHMVPIIKDDEVPNVLDDDSNDDDDKKVNKLKQLCGISIRRIMKLNRDDVYEMRSVILFHEGELSAAFKKKMGREFCLNAAATKLIFVAGLQDRSCSLNNEQLNIVHYGVEQFLSETEYDLPSAVAKWIIHDETSEDKTSRLQRDDEEWNRIKKTLPTFLKHEVIAFIFGETYFSLTDIDANDEKKAKRKRRKKGEPVIHRNTNYIASCVKELHDVNLPKKKYMKLIWGCLHELNITSESAVNKSLVFCVSFYMPLSEKEADEKGNLEVKSLVLDKTWHPEKMNAADGFNEYDNIRVRRTGRMTTLPFDNETGNGGVLLLKIYGELFIERHATLDADSCGYSGGWTYQCQGDSVGKCGRTSRYCNFGGGGGGYYGGGGGYGSRGSTAKSDIPSILKCGEGGRYYGDRLVHLTAYMGSGGGSGGGKYLYSRGGRGGGIVVLIAGSIHNKGRIMSLGQRGKYLAGSGSGGSIVIECNSYYHYGKGAILASSLEAYPDILKKQSGGIGGCGRVAMKINRQKWTSEMRKAICTNNLQQIWTPAAWIYPIPKWCAPDVMNKRTHLSPKFIGFHVISRIEDSVYKNCTLFRNDIADGPLINNYSSVGQVEFKDLQSYKRRKEKERKTLYQWKFDEFALEKEDSHDKHRRDLRLQKRKSEYVAYRSSTKLIKT